MDAYDPVKNGELYNSPTEFWVHMKLQRLIKMCLYGAKNTGHISNHLSHNFHIQGGLKQGHALTPLPFSFSLECH
jgi:hypothetical protein